MPTCPTCSAEIDQPDYRRTNVEPADEDGRRVVTGADEWYWLLVCPECDAILGAVDAA